MIGRSARRTSRCVFPVVHLAYGLDRKCKVKNVAAGCFLISVGPSASCEAVRVLPKRVVLSRRSTCLAVFPMGVIQPFCHSKVHMLLRHFLRARKDGLKGRRLSIHEGGVEVWGGARRRVFPDFQLP